MSASSPTGVAIVTGSSAGIGAGIARLLGSRGWAVTVNDRSGAERAAQVVEDIRGSGGQAIAVGADAHDPAGLASLVEATLAEFGRLDAAVGNATVPFRPALIEEMDVENLHGKVWGEVAAAFHLTRACLPTMKAQGSGRLVFISSLQSQAAAAAGMTANGTGKAALAAFARYAGWELTRYGIMVNVVSASLVETAETSHLDESVREAMRQATPVGRLSTPDDVARSVAFLVGEDGGFTTGVDLSAGGGFGLSWLPQVGPDLLPGG